MLKKLNLIFQTSKHLKFTQVFHQIHVRFKLKRDLKFYLKNLHYTPEFNELKFNYSISTKNNVKDNLIFVFLNKEKYFANEIDWDFKEYGKLWNYNLQYFEYLNQQNIDNSTKNQFLKSLHLALSEGTLALEPYPVSLRIMNTIKYYSRSEIVDKEIVRGLYGQLKYLSENLEFHLLGNHLLENGFALLMGGAYLNNTGWISKAEKLLVKELKEQILEDGAHFELSPMYHQIIFFRVLELIEWYSVWEKRNQRSLEFFREIGSKMYSWLRNVTFKNNEIPMFNDSANEISFSSEELFKYAQHLNLEIKSLSLKESGYRKIENDSCECIIDVGNISCDYQPGHGHADALSFILHYQKQPIFVEAGTSTYEADEIRYYERSTKAHNTVEINSDNQSDVWGVFRVGDRAKVNIIEESNNILVAEHNGYKKKFKVNHHREFSLYENAIRIKDELSHSNIQNGKAFLHLHPNIEISITSEDFINLKNVGEVKFNGHSAFNIDTFNFSIGFNKRVQSKVIIIDFDKSLETYITFI